MAGCLSGCASWLCGSSTASASTAPAPSSTGDAGGGYYASLYGGGESAAEAEEALPGLTATPRPLPQAEGGASVYAAGALRATAAPGSLNSDQQNALDWMEQLMEGRPKKSEADASRLLYDAAWAGDFSNAFDAIDDGADVARGHGRGGLTPLHVAARTNNTPILRLLLNKSAPVEAKNAYGETPLFGAVKERNVGATQALIDAKADVNARDAAGRRLLSLAQEAGREDFLEFLVANGALDD